MIEASVIGWPISHSRSPLIHGYWLKQHGLQGRYVKEAVEPQRLGPYIKSLRHGIRVGTNVTLPHKEDAFQHVDEPDERARRIGALNTIWRADGKLHATSTDGLGFVANLKQSQPSFGLAGARVTILGAGGSTRAIVDELLREDVASITIQNRTHARAENLAVHFGASVRAIEASGLESVLKETQLLINTTSAGVKDDDTVKVPWIALKEDAVVADISYTPLVTPFLQHAKATDHAVVTGLGMLLHQAVFGFEKWFGVRPEVTQDLHDLVARDIDPAYAP
jgi:shikimate dehydrogenase